MFRMKFHHEILASSANSLRVTHIIAFNFRVLIKKWLGLEPSNVEQNSLGPVVGRMLMQIEDAERIIIGVAPRKETSRNSEVSSDDSLLTIERERRYKF